MEATRQGRKESGLGAILEKGVINNLLDKI
jgi:hypothetical protein